MRHLSERSEQFTGESRHLFVCERRTADPRRLASGAPVKRDRAASYSAHVTSQRRDRHGRGLRGPLSLPNSLTTRRAHPPHPASKADFFTEAVHDAVDRIGLQCPDVLVGITFGIEDVPHFDMAWSGDQVPLAAALEGTANQPSQVVVYRQPARASRGNAARPTDSRLSHDRGTARRAHRPQR